MSDRVVRILLKIVLCVSTAFGTLFVCMTVWPEPEKLTGAQAMFVLMSLVLWIIVGCSTVSGVVGSPKQ